MWIGLSRDKTSKPFGKKWPQADELIKALSVYYSYDIKLLHKKNFIEGLDSVKKLINIFWSSRGLSIFGKVTIIIMLSSALIPKHSSPVYMIPIEWIDFTTD